MTRDRLTSQIESIRSDLASWDYKSAERKASQLVKRNPERGDLWMLFAEVLVQSAQTVKAEKTLLQLLSLDSVNYPEANRWIADRRFNQGMYAEASYYFGRYEDYRKNLQASQGDSLLKQSIRFAMDQIKGYPDISIKKLDGKVNTSDDEYFPNLTADGRTLVFTRLKASLGDSNDSSKQEDLYQSEWIGTFFSAPDKIGPPVGTPWNEGAQTIRQDGRIMIFTACNRPEGKGGCDLYISEKTGNTWSNPVNLDYPVNTRYWESTPSLSFDGNFLFFSSNRPGGYGGMDIWRSERLRTGGWSNPVNVGKPINTPGDEMTPVCLPDPGQLFFASNGHPGMGGFDIFRSARMPGGTWGEPANLGFPINTHYNEDGFTISGVNDFAVIASDRDSLGGKDLYQIPWQGTKDSSLNIVLAGKVLNSANMRPVPAVVLVQTLNNTILGRVESDPATGNYQITVPQGTGFILDATSRGFLPLSEGITEVTDTLSGLIRKDLLLHPVAAGAVVVLQNIYFTTDSYELLPESSHDLESIFDFISANPEFSFEIRGHTDATGTPQYNEVLSRKRAESVRNYLINKGIPATRLHANGYGAKEPIAGNGTEEERKLNRRTEIKVLQNR